MQVVHAFVYLIPVIFFFGLGPEPATMVTMVFAIPPLIRLTNLGIRQVPGDVVEASRAYGASEWRVLIDVQLPLARPAIMTGLNQTLLLSISMLGIAAIIGAGGLGLLVFRAVTNLDTPLSSSAGLALFIVAVVLDRISQTKTEEGTVGLFSRIRRAWVHRRDPEILLEGTGTESTDTEAGDTEGVLAAVGTAERTGVLIALTGSVLALAALFLPWGRDSGLISGYGRETDLDLAGQAFNGLAAEGGSFFGVAVLGMSLLILGAAVTTLIRPGEGSRWFGADGALSAAVGLLVAGRRILVAGTHRPLGGLRRRTRSVDGTDRRDDRLRRGIRLGQKRPLQPTPPLPDRVSVVRIVIAAAIVGLLVVAGLSSWSVDGRASSVLTPELQAEIDSLEQEAREDSSKAAANAATIGQLIASAQRQDKITFDGFTERGTRFGYLTLILGIAAFLLTLPASGLLGGGDVRRWRWSAAVSALGVGVMLVAAGWIASLVRTSDPNYISGPGGVSVPDGRILDTHILPRGAEGVPPDKGIRGDNKPDGTHLGWGFHLSRSRWVDRTEECRFALTDISPKQRETPKGSNGKRRRRTPNDTNEKCDGAVVLAGVAGRGMWRRHHHNHTSGACHHSGARHQRSRGGPGPLKRLPRPLKRLPRPRWRTLKPSWMRPRPRWRKPKPKPRRETKHPRRRWKRPGRKPRQQRQQQRKPRRKQRQQRQQQRKPRRR